VKNLILQPHVRQKIDTQVDRLLRDLDSPEPPLQVEDVLELLHLDLAYYRGDSDGLLQETIHRLRMAGKQVIADPMRLWEAIRKFSLKALYAPDRRRILIDENLPTAKHRWAKGHEIIHDVLEWHLPVLRGDDQLTLKQSCLAKIESEANYGAGQLLFLRHRFNEQVLASPPSVELVREMVKTFGNTHSSMLWRLVEAAGAERPLFGAIHYHPHPRFHSKKFDPENPCRHFIQSDAFARRFSDVDQHRVYELIAGYVAPRRGGPLGEGICVLLDDNGVTRICPGVI
jgi:hypothetical protein